MRVFLTGGSGFIGSAVIPELLGAGHSVLALARSDEAAEAVAAAGAEPLRGSLHDLDALRSGAQAADGVIHLAFIHDFANYAASVEADSAAIAALGEALADSGKPFVGTSGTLIVAGGGLATETTPTSPDSPRQSEAVLAFAERGVRTSVVRLAPTVHGEGDHGFVPALIGFARRHGSAAYVGDGATRWPAVHRLDAAKLFRLALESAPAGSALHGTAEQGIPFRAIAEAIGRGLGVPAISVAPDRAGDWLGFLGAFAQIDNPTSSERTQELLGWRPTGPALLEDLAAGHYFT